MERFPSLVLSLGGALRRLPWKTIYLFAKKTLVPYLALLKVRLLAALAGSIHQLDKYLDELTHVFVREVGKRLFRNENTLVALERTVRLMGAELSASRILIFKLMIGAICVFLVGVMLPLLMRAMFKMSVRVFISFSHECEEVAQIIEKTLSATSIKPIRVPYVEGSTHQVIIDNVLTGIAKCDLLVCIPANSGSFVDGEVFAASASKKPIIFIVSEFSGSLPDTADKRYPVFSIERLRNARFKPLSFLIGYLAYDFHSALLLCLGSAVGPITNVSSRFAVRTLICAFSIAVMISFGIVKEATNSISPATLALGNNILEAAVIHFIVLGAFSALTFVVCIYVIAFVRRLFIQSLSSRRIRLRTGSGVFNRVDWIKIMDDFGNNNHVFDCLMDKAIKAHHELQESTSA